jgi:hypothetical protein
LHTLSRWASCRSCWEAESPTTVRGWCCAVCRGAWSWSCCGKSTTQPVHKAAARVGVEREKPVARLAGHCIVAGGGDGEGGFPATLEKGARLIPPHPSCLLPRPCVFRCRVAATIADDSGDAVLIVESPAPRPPSHPTPQASAGGSATAIPTTVREHVACCLQRPLLCGRWLPCLSSSAWRLAYRVVLVALLSRSRLHVPAPLPHFYLPPQPICPLPFPSLVHCLYPLVSPSLPPPSPAFPTAGCLAGSTARPRDSVPRKDEWRDRGAGACA